MLLNFPLISKSQWNELGAKCAQLCTAQEAEREVYQTLIAQSLLAADKRFATRQAVLKQLFLMFHKISDK